MIKVGDKLPEVMLKIAGDQGPQDISTQALFGGIKTAFFAVPGAFTPTCSAKHLPGYVSLNDQLKAKGVDQIVCLAVNDAFVMKAWGESCHVNDKIIMASDGNGTFTKAVGLEMDAQGYTMGTRSQRYAMIVDDGKVTKLFIEQPGTFEVSSAEHLLAQL